MARHCNATRVVPQRVLNSHFTTGTAADFAKPTASQWRPGDFVAHAYGLASSAMDDDRQQVRSIGQLILSVTVLGPRSFERG